MSAVDLIVLPQHVDHMFDPEDGTQSFVLSHEAKADETVPLSEVDGRRGVLWLNPHDTRFDLRRRLEAVSGNFDQMVNPC